MPKHAKDCISLLPGRDYIEGKIMRWEAPFYIDMGRKTSKYHYYRVMSSNPAHRPVGLYAKFPTAYMVLQFICDETRLRGWHTYPTLTRLQIKTYMDRLEHKKLGDRAAREAARDRKHREVWGPAQNAKRRARTAALLQVENLARAPGSKPRRGYGEAKDLPYLQRRDPLFGED